MFANYLAAALRNLARNRLYSVITTFCLAVGFAAMILATLYWRYDHSFDRFWPASDRLYMATQVISSPRGVSGSEGVPSRLGSVVAAQAPGVEAVGRLDFEGVKLTIGPTSYPHAGVFWVDPELLTILPRKVVAGDLAATLADPSAVVIDEGAAKKYFGDHPALGQMITIAADRKTPITFTVRVGAVIRDLPAQTHLQDGGLYLSTRSGLAKIEDKDEEALTYFRVRPGVSPDAVRAAVAAIRAPELAPKEPREQRKLLALPIHEVFLHNGGGFNLGGRNTPTTSHAGVLNTVLMMGLGGLILAVAALNFITLMTARGAGRAVEVGVRKAAGARRRDLVAQFVGEAVLYAALAFAAGLALAELFLPVVRLIGIEDLKLDYRRDAGFIGLLALGALLTGIVAGLYPALALSGFKPAAVLKGGMAKSPGSALLRQILVTAQFTPAFLLAFGALTLFTQMEQSSKNALTMLDPSALSIEEPCTPFLHDRIAALPGVKSVTCLEKFGSSNSPQTGSWHIGQTMAGKVLKANGARAQVRPTLTDAQGLAFFDVKLLAGRMWTGGDDQGVIVNETAMRELGFPKPEGAVGKAVSWTKGETQLRSTIIGVTADRGGFPGYEEPLYYLDPNAKRTLSIGVRLLAGADRAVLLRSLDALWKETGALRPMEREFFDDWVDENRDGTRKVMGILAPIAGAGVVIAGLGLFGLAAFLAEQRTKEIGVRKALGASRADLMRMLLFQFTRPVLIAALIAAPIVFVLLNLLMGQAPPDQRITPSPVVYAMVLGGAVVISLAATFTHAWRVTGARPVTALRYE